MSPSAPIPPVAAWTPGNLRVGATGQGEITISGGGTVAGTGQALVGANAGSQGTVTVTGAGSSLSTATQMHVGSSGNGVLTIENGAAVSVGSFLYIGRFNGAEGGVTVSGAGSNLTASNMIQVGSEGKGTLTIEDGATVQSTNVVRIGLTATGEGSALVHGAGSSWITNNSMSVGYGGYGTLNIEAGGMVRNVDGFVGREAGATGEVMVSGTGSIWTNTGVLYVGSNSSGTLIVADGGTVTNASYGYVGYATGSNGTATVTGAGSTWSSAGSLRIGHTGTGALTVADGGKVESLVGTIGANPTGSGTVFVTGPGSTWISTTFMSIGFDGHGTLSIENGGAIKNETGFIGRYAGATGEVTVSGTGSIWTNTGALSIGEAGTGTLTVSNGGKVENTSASIGGSTNGNGTVMVTGPGSSWANSSFLYIGNLATGALTVSDGGVVTNAEGRIGNGVGTTGTVTITGAHSTWINANQLRVGNGGTGTLLIADGGLVQNVTGWVGGLAGSIGTVTVTGTGSTWTNTGTLYVGDLGKGTLTVSGGGKANISGGFTIGRQAGAEGLVTVSGAGSILTNSGDLTIGNSGSATLTIADGGHVGVGGGTGIVQIAQAATANGAVNIGAAAGDAPAGAGTLAAGEIRFGSGTGTLNFNHSNATTFAAALSSTGTGTHTLNHDAGITTLTGNSSGFTGTTTISGGTLTVANALGGSASVTGGAFVVNGTFGGPVAARTGGVVSGTGTIAGNADLTGGGVLAGASGQTLRANGNVLMDASSVVNATLGGPSTTGLFNVGGNLTLDGTLNITNAGGFGAGVYRIFDYAGTLTDNGLAIGSTPAGVSASNLTVQTAVASQVNLISTSGAALSFWDGGNAALHDNGIVNGGSGVWRADGRNWTQATGVFNGPFQPVPTYAVFQATGGVVTVNNTAGAIGVTGMQFAANSYRIEGGAIALQGAGGESIVRVGDGTAAGAGMIATIAATLTGNSTLVKSDYGTLVLSGVNTFNGGVRLDAGKLSVSADANLGAASGGLIFNGGTLATNASFGSSRAVTLDAAGRFDVATGTTLGLSGAITGAGTLIKQGDGTLVLTGSNAYRSTQVAAGTLIGNAASISGNLANAATVVFDQNTHASFAGTIGGYGGTDGTMVKRGTGTLTLAGISSLDWSIETGGLVADASRFGGNAALSSGTALTFNQSGNAFYTGILSGAGAFNLSGPGAVTLTGNSSAFAGLTTVGSGARLVVGTSAGGALGGSIAIGSGGLLGGTGNLGSVGSTVAIAAGGVHAPGNGLGQQTVLGDYVLRGTLQIDGTPAGTDRLVARGGVDIAGSTLDLLLSPVTAASWSVVNGPFTIIDNQGSGPVTGTFAAVHSNLIFLNPHLNYTGGDGNDVTLGLVRNDVAFSSVALTPNQRATSGAIDTLPFGNPVWNAIALMSDDNAARRSFDLLSGEIHAASRGVLLEESRFIRNAVNDRIRAAFDGVGASRGPVVIYENGTPRTVAAATDRLAVWGHGFGAWGHTDSDGNAARLDRSNGGFFIGADAPMFDSWRFGAVAGYSRTTFNVADRSSSGASDNYHVGLYGGTTWGNLSFRTGAATAWHDIATNRSVAIPRLSDSLKADYNAGTTQIFGELGYGIRTGNVAFEPFANFAYVSLQADSFTEKGQAAALTGQDATTDARFTTLGLRGSTTFDLAGATVAARSTVGWRHAFGDVTPLSTMRFVGGGDAFTIAGLPIARDAAVVEGGLDLALSPNTTLGVSSSGQFGSGFSEQSVRANFNVRF